MPTYDYTCKKCGNVEERFVDYVDRDQQRCECGYYFVRHPPRVNTVIIGPQRKWEEARGIRVKEPGEDREVRRRLKERRRKADKAVDKIVTETIREFDV